MAMQDFQNSSLSGQSVPGADAGKDVRICKQLMAFAALVLMLALDAPATAMAQHDDGQSSYHGGSGAPLPTDRLGCKADCEQSLGPTRRQRLAAYVLGGVGFAGMGVGTFLVHRGHSRLDEAPDTEPTAILDLEEQGLRYRRFGFAMIGIGGVAFVSSAIFLLLTPRPMKGESIPRLLPSGTASSAGLLLRGAF